MKTKIIYISGDEVFDIADIRAAFEEVRNALNLDKTTVLFGVPVDADDAGFATKERPEITKEKETIVESVPETVDIPKETPEIIAETPKEIIEEETIEESVIEPVVEEAPKKRGRTHKEKVTTESVVEENEPTDTDEKIVPILSILSTKSEPDEEAEEISISQEIEEVEIIPEISDEKTEEIADEEPVAATDKEEEEADLEKLLSAMTPLQEDVLDDDKSNETPKDEPEYNDDISVDATLEQLATEFAETQDKITSGNKSSARSKIGKLRNILPFKQSKHKDQGLGDLFGWAGVAANDEDFSVPGFFTNAASKK